jgi:small-conductance mechanosensitive channel
MADVNDLLAQIFLDNPLRRWLLALLIAVGFVAAVRLWRRIVIRRLSPVVIETGTFFDEVGPVMARTTSLPVTLVIAAFLGSLLLRFPPNLKTAANSAAIIAALIQIAIWGNALIRRWVERYEERNWATNAAGAGTANLVGLFARIGLYSLVVLLILDNIPGVEVTALVASLGIGGVAVALATQNILSDVFASLSIALDKPFVVGDTIAVRDDVGTVEQIGLKTTRLRSIAGEQLIFANGDLLSSRIRNFARQEQRRIVFSFRVLYSTSPAQLRAIPELLRAAIEPIAQARFDRAHLLRFDDLGLLFEVVYHVETADFARYMDIQQQINLAILEQLAEAGIGFASLHEPSQSADGSLPSSELRRRSPDAPPAPADRP